MAWSIDLEAGALKAVYLFNFSKYASWPDSIAPSADNPINFCIHADRDVYQQLKKAEDRTVNGAPIAVFYSEDLGDLEECHVLYSPYGQASEFRSIFDKKLAQDCLLVGNEGAGFLIEFIEKGSRLNFSVNLSTLNQTTIILSSELLKLSAGAK